jgi:ABC-2 type transport system permease protein
MQYKASFLMLTFTYFLSTAAEILGIWVLFDRFKTIQGWTLEEVMLIYGIMHIGFAIAEGLGRGFDKFDLLVKNGGFDRILLRPLGTKFQIAARDVQFMRIGRLIQGLIVLVWGFNELHLSLISWHTLLLLFSLLGSTALFYGLFVIQGTLSFWTTESLELMNIGTYGGLESGQYPMSIYKTPFRLFFTFLIPIACVAYYPIASLLTLDNIPLWLGLLSPFTGFIFLYLACKFWNHGVRRYHSTGN